MDTSRVKHDWYQTGSHVVITLSIKKKTKDDVTVECTAQTCCITVKLDDSTDYSMDLSLWGTIDPDNVVVRVIPVKIEIKLPKTSGVKWMALEGDADAASSAVPAQTMETAEAVPTAPQKKDPAYWDKLAKEVEEEEKKEVPEGDAALNKLFQTIYKDASDDTRRAMMKSYYESNGTVLSTNWDEVGAKQVEMKPPEGVEFKKF
eukprot:m.356520 g.356520  ORF g.356520 m.356520 type:complete len:204 (+) comp17561_c0_seq1:195-806(+)